MAVSIIQSNTGTGFNASDHGSLTGATTAGSTIVVGLISFSTTTSIAAGATSISDATNGTYTLKSLETVVPTHYAGGIAVQFGYFPAAASLGALASISWVLPAGATVDWTIWELSASIFDQSSVGTATGTAVASSSLTPSGNGAVGLALTALDDGVGAGNVWTAGTGYTLDLHTGGGSLEVGSEHIAQATAAALTGAFTSSRSGQWVADQIIFVPSGGGSAVNGAATLAATMGLSASGSVVGSGPGVTGSATLAATMGLTASGQVSGSRQGSATLAATMGLTASASVTGSGGGSGQAGRLAGTLKRALHPLSGRLGYPR